MSIRPTESSLQNKQTIEQQEDNTLRTKVLNREVYEITLNPDKHKEIKQVSEETPKKN